MATKQFDRDDFAAFLDLLPETQDGLPLRHAIEVRHESFRDPAFVDLARERNMAIVFADSDEFPCIDEATADFAYARLQRSRDDIETGRSEEHTSELQSLMRISYAVICVKKKNNINILNPHKLCHMTLRTICTVT